MNDVLPPREIQRFETVQVIAVAISFIHVFASPEIEWFDAIFAALLVVGMTLLISRKRKNWARWVLTASFGLSLALMAYAAPAIIENGISILSVAALSLQAFGIALLFSPRSSEWLRHSPPPIAVD